MRRVTITNNFDFRLFIRQLVEPLHLTFELVRHGDDAVGQPLIGGGGNAFCSGQLAHYKIPRYVHIVEEFPMTVTGKVRKVEMRERSVEILGLDAT